MKAKTPKEFMVDIVKIQELQILADNMEYEVNIEKQMKNGY
jgi:hypothetical protein